MGIASYDQPTSEERSTYFTFSEIQISPKEEMDVYSLFLLLTPNYQLEHGINREFAYDHF